MLGSTKKCSNCQGLVFRRILANRTIQCATCKTILEEYCNHDLAEYHVTTQSEELHCVVSPDFLRKHIVDDIPNDPYCTPGFITAFRMLSPQYEPVFGAPARTMSGALAEMERLIGDALYSGYVGYNGRAPGGGVRPSDASEPSDRGKAAGGDARHILVAYFEIKELASILGVDAETCTLAIRIFRYTASNTSLRNRSVEALAAAAFGAAVLRRVRGADDAKTTTSSGPSNTGTTASSSSNDPPWLTKLRSLTVRAIAHAANIDEPEVQKNLKVVNQALRKQRPDSNESVIQQMPSFCRELGLDDTTRRLALHIAEKAMELNICARRLPLSVAAACIYMACHLDCVRKTQADVCRATTVTEVTLRKVRTELAKEETKLVPQWFVIAKKARGAPTTHVSALRMPNVSSQDLASRQAAPFTAVGQQLHAPSSSKSRLPLPPPLPPGYTQIQAQRTAQTQQQMQGQVQAQRTAQAQQQLRRQSQIVTRVTVQRSMPNQRSMLAQQQVPTQRQMPMQRQMPAQSQSSAQQQSPAQRQFPTQRMPSAQRTISAQAKAANVPVSQPRPPPPSKGTPGSVASTPELPKAPTSDPNVTTNPLVGQGNATAIANTQPVANGATGEGVAAIAATMASMDPAQQTAMMMAMMQNPAVVQAFANAMAKMPNVLPNMMPPPPPPPPLPPKLPSPGRSKDGKGGTGPMANGEAEASSGDR